MKGPDGKEHEIQFVYRDNASAGPDKTKQLAEELVLREKVKFLAGFDLSPHAMAVADIATQAKIPVVIMNAATASITRGSPYYVRVSMTIPQHVVSLAKWAYDNGIRKVYTIVSDYAPGYDAENYFNKTFKALGGEIVGSARTPQQETNYAAYMEKVLQAKPDALYMFQPAGSPSIAFVKAYVERGLKTAGIKLIGTGETQQLFLPNFTDDVIGIVTAFHYTETNTNPENIALKSQLMKMFGDKAVPDIASVAAWDGTEVDLSGGRGARPQRRRRQVRRLHEGQEARQPARADHDRSRRARRDPEHLHPPGREARRQARQHRHRQGRRWSRIPGRSTIRRKATRNGTPSALRAEHCAGSARIDFQATPQTAPRRSTIMLSFAATILLDGVSYGMVLFLISVGLTITMGLMRVVNLAHGSFAMIGGYVAGYLTQNGVNFYLALVCAAAVAGALGGIAELTVYRPLYRKGELCAGAC